MLLFNYSKKEVEEKFKCYITDIWKKTNTIFMADTGPDIGLFEKSDIVLTFSPDDTLAIQTERAFRKDYTDADWAQLSLLTYKFADVGEDSKGIKTSVTYNVDFIDVVRYKKEWMDWAKELTQVIY